jgi:hypothetical protein
MRKTLLSLALLATTALFAEHNYDYQSTIYMGHNNFDSSSKMTDNNVFGIRATAYDEQYYGWQLGYEMLSDIKHKTALSTIPGKGDQKKLTDVHRGYVNLVVDGKEELGITPYVLLGGGYEYLTQETKNDVSQGFLQAGLGFKYNINNYLNAAIEGRALGKVRTRDIDFILTAGLGFMFGHTDVNVREDIKIEEANLLKPKEDISTIVNEGITAPSPIISPVYQTHIEKKSVANGEYYIQIGAFAETSPQPFINRLIKSGYSNVIVKSVESGNKSLNDMKIVLVGPYESRRAAEADLLELRTVSNGKFRGAFIKRIKDRY